MSKPILYGPFQWEKKRLIETKNPVQTENWLRKMSALGAVGSPKRARSGNEMQEGDEVTVKQVFFLCQRCKQEYNPLNNGNQCRYHPEYFSGETKQRFQEAGDPLNSGEVVMYWSCCGAGTEDAPGCCVGSHLSYDEEESIFGASAKNLAYVNTQIYGQDGDVEMKL